MRMVNHTPSREGFVMRALMLVIAVFGSMSVVPSSSRAEDQYAELKGRTGLEFKVPPGGTLTFHYENKVFKDGYECEFVLYRDKKRATGLAETNSYKRKAGTISFKNDTDKVQTYNIIDLFKVRPSGELPWRDANFVETEKTETRWVGFGRIIDDPTRRKKLEQFDFATVEVTIK